MMRINAAFADMMRNRAGFYLALLDLSLHDDDDEFRDSVDRARPAGDAAADRRGLHVPALQPLRGPPVQRQDAAGRHAPRRRASAAARVAQARELAAKVLSWLSENDATRRQRVREHARPAGSAAERNRVRATSSGRSTTVLGWSDGGVSAGAESSGRDECRRGSAGGSASSVSRGGDASPAAVSVCGAASSKRRCSRGRRTACSTAGACRCSAASSQCGAGRSSRASASRRGRRRQRGPGVATAVDGARRSCAWGGCASGGSCRRRRRVARRPAGASASSAGHEAFGIDAILADLERDRAARWW
jgi:hypothetical protein